MGPTLSLAGHCDEFSLTVAGLQQSPPRFLGIGGTTTWSPRPRGGASEALKGRPYKSVSARKLTEVRCGNREQQRVTGRADEVIK